MITGRKNTPRNAPFRVCRTCGVTLPRACFYESTKQVFTSCKECIKAQVKLRYRERFPEPKRITQLTQDKRCPDCGIRKPITEFERNPYRTHAVGTYCNDCKRARNNKMHEVHAEKAKLRNIKLRKKLIAEDPKRYKAAELLRSVQDRANRLGLPFDLDFEFILALMVDVCPVLGIPLNYTFVAGVNFGDSPTVDRFIPKLGYVKGNVTVISWRANRIKCDASPSEAMKVALWMQKQEQARLRLIA